MNNIVIGLSLPVLGLACVSSLKAETPRNLRLAGDGPTAVWDIGKTAVWSDGTGRTTFSDGDAVTIDDAFVGTTVTMSDRLSPSSVTVDIAAGKTITLGWSNVSYGLSSGLGAFTKKGDGALVMTSSNLTASSGERGNSFSCDADILGGEVYLKDANSWQLFGSHDVEHWVKVHRGASFTFTERNQAGTPAAGSALDLELADGAILNFHTNYTAGAANLCNTINWLKFTSQSVLRYGGWNSSANASASSGFAYITGGLQFSGAQPHNFSKTVYQATGKTAGGFIALPTDRPIVFRVDDVTGDEAVDADLNLNAFVWQSNAENAIHIIKDGPGTAKFKSLKNGFNANYYGDISVTNGTAVFSSQGLLPSAPESGRQRLQTLRASNGATLCFEYRNIMDGAALAKPPLKIEIDHATFKFAPVEGGSGMARAQEWVFDDANLEVRNEGLSTLFGVWGFLDKVTFKGSHPCDLAVNPEVSANCQTIHVGYSPRTEVVVEDITGDSRSDVTFSMPIKNTATNGTASVVTAVSGFVKKGRGSLAIASSTNKLSGEVTVSEGVLRVDGVLNTPSAVSIEAGGCLGGTGTVARVSMAAGAGFAVCANDNGKFLTISGDLSLPSHGVVVMDETDGVKFAKFAEVTGRITASDLSGWRVERPDGTLVKRTDGLWVRGNSLFAGERQGLAIILR